MERLLTITGAFLSSGKASGELFAPYALVLFFKISAVVFVASRVFRWLQTRSEGEATHLRSGSLTTPAEITGLVAKVAHQNLEIGSHQLDESVEKLRIPKGDFLRFLDDLRWTTVWPFLNRRGRCPYRYRESSRLSAKGSERWP